MPTIRDDSAGSYGTWNNDELSWLDYLKAKASDGGNALANLGRNLVDGFSPIGTSEQGNMALQVPPIVSGIAQSYSNLAGSPSHPGNAYDLTGVPELDAPIQQDMSNVLLSLYGGNAVSGLRRSASAAISPDLAIARTAERAFPDELSALPSNGYWNSDEGLLRLNSSISPNSMRLTETDMRPVASNDARGVLASNPFNVIDGDLLSDTGKPSILGSAMAGAGEKKPIDIRKADQGKNWGVYHALVGGDVAGYADYGVGPNAAVVRGVAVDPAFQRQGVASALHGRIQDDLGLPLTPDNTLSQAGYDFWKASYPEAVRDHKPNGAGYWIDDVNRDISKGVPEWRMSGGPNRPDGVLWSDNRPSLLGSALATAGENYDLPPWLQF